MSPNNTKKKFMKPQKKMGTINERFSHIHYLSSPSWFSGQPYPILRQAISYAAF